MYQVYIGNTLSCEVTYPAFLQSIMSFKCPICLRTFSRRTAYSQHVQFCLKKVDEEYEEYSSSEIDTESVDNIEVTMFVIL